jgi:hypothetical protein
MAYDSARGRVVLFGGYGNDYLADTWEWDGTTWAQRAPVTSPSIRYGCAMVYDNARARVVLFGGYNGAVSNPYLSETWEWDGTTWAQRAPVTSPVNRSGHAMAYDSVRSLVVLFGGYNYGSLNDTWEWDGSVWVQRTPAAVLYVRSSHSMVYDSARGRAVLFGGLGGGALSDTWEYGLPATCGYAQSVVAFVPGNGGSASALGALGAPDQQAVSLGVNGYLTVHMEWPILDSLGADLVVSEIGTSSGDLNENFGVEASDDGVSFTFIRNCRGDDCQIDLLEGGLRRASDVRITDIHNPQYFGSAVQVDGVSAVNCVSPVELCNGLDDDGDGSVPSDEIDQDGDGHAACSSWSGNVSGIIGGGDCDDTRAFVHPGAPETCDGIDDDCNGLIDDVLAAPTGAATLTEDRSGTDAILSWSAIPGATAYDIVKGDLLALREGGGNFTASTGACLANDLGALSAQDTESLVPGTAVWHLVRASGCGVSGSFDEPGTSQVASRDPGIQGAGAACP